MKYMRLWGFKYSDGSQEYTDEYTWEDWVAASKSNLERMPGELRTTIINDIYDFFKLHPEKLLEGGPAKEAGVTVDDLNKFFNTDCVKPTWWI